MLSRANGLIMWTMRLHLNLEIHIVSGQVVELQVVFAVKVMCCVAVTNLHA
jgi:hypothetical protein